MAIRAIFDDKSILCFQLLLRSKPGHISLIRMYIASKSSIWMTIATPIYTWIHMYIRTRQKTIDFISILSNAMYVSMYISCDVVMGWYLNSMTRGMIYVYLRLKCVHRNSVNLISYIWYPSVHTRTYEVTYQVQHGSRLAHHHANAQQLQECIYDNKYYLGFEMSCQMNISQKLMSCYRDIKNANTLSIGME